MQNHNIHYLYPNVSDNSTLKFLKNYELPVGMERRHIQQGADGPSTECTVFYFFKKKKI